MTSLTPDQVRTAYLRLLGREPEKEGLWSDVDAVSALLDIAGSQEHERYLANRMVSTSPFQLAETGDTSFLTYAADKVIGESLRLTGQFEERHVETVVSLIEASGHAVDRKAFADVGANIGTHTLRALQIGFETAVCVEADRANYKLLRINQILNEVDHRCSNILAAASASTGEVTLEISPDNFGDHRVRLSPAVSTRHGEEKWQTRRIASRRLDDILTENLGSPDAAGLVWIDTQGHEANVLAGAPELLKSTTPLVVEFWPYGLSRSGGLQPLLDAVLRRSHIYEIRQSEKADTLVPITRQDIEAMYRSMLADPMGETPHTDLLLV